MKKLHRLQPLRPLQGVEPIPVALLAFAAFAAAAAGASDAGRDWPCWRGPARNGISEETGWTADWGTNGPPVLWRLSVGKGFSSFAAVGGRVYTMGNEGGTDTVFCVDAGSGRMAWRHSYPCDPQPLSYEGGPGSTPAVDGDRVYTFSKGGDLFCLDAGRGRVVWSRRLELWPRLPGDWQNNWRYAGSPLVSGDRLFLGVGQAGIALDKRDGRTLWQSAAGHPGYSSPVPFRSEAGDRLAFFSGHEVVGVAAADGRPAWRIPWKTLWDLNAADPIVHEGRVFVSSGNNVGCALFDLAADPPREMWRNKNLKNMMNSSVLWQGHLFGFNDSDLACVDWSTGELKWSTRELRRGSLIVAGGRLIALCERGRLCVAEATGQAFRPLAMAQVIGGRCWTTPVLSHGRLFVRNAAGEVVALAVGGERAVLEGRPAYRVRAGPPFPHNSTIARPSASPTRKRVSALPNS